MGRSGFMGLGYIWSERCSRVRDCGQQHWPRETRTTAPKRKTVPDKAQAWGGAVGGKLGTRWRDGAGTVHAGNQRVNTCANHCALVTF